jgi:hypothetical protein
MQKFYYFLEDNPNYPNMIMAKNKLDVKRIVTEDLGSYGSNIVSILSEDEFFKAANDQPQTCCSENNVNPNVNRSTIISENNKSAIYADSSEYESSASFMNDVLNAASNSAINASLNNVENNEDKNQVYTNTEKLGKVEFIMNNTQTCQNTQTDIEPPRYFEDSGIQFKLEKGILYKKVWAEISSDDINDFRIINVKTNKNVDRAKFKLEKLIWKKI